MRAQTPGGSKFLQHGKNALDVGLRRAKALGGLAEVARQIAGLVDEVDQILADHALGRCGEGHRELLGQMVAECGFRGDEGFEIVVLVAGGTAAPFRIGGRRCILGVARCGLGRLLGEDVVQARIQGLLDLGAGAEILAHPFFLAGLEGLAAAAKAIVALTVTLAAGLLAIAVLAGLGRGLARGGLVIGPFQQGVTLELLFHEGREIEIGQLQQLDRLHQLRRHDQRLRLPEL
ncbi:hypothetical protein ABH990_001233 [Bradyrhizobium ottawaense]